MMYSRFDHKRNGAYHVEDLEEATGENPPHPEEEKLDEDLEEKTNEFGVEELEEETEEDQEDEPEEEPDEDLEEEPDDNAEEKILLDSADEAVFESCVASKPLSLSCHKNNETVALTEYLNEDLPDEYVLDLSNAQQSECVQSFTNERKRSLDATVTNRALLPHSHMPKKCRYGEAVKPKTSIDSDVTDLLGKSGASETIDNEGTALQQQDHGSCSGKRRFSRWEPQPENDGGRGEGYGTNKRRKTRWANDDSQLKMLGPIQLPGLMKDCVEPELDPEIRKLKRRLVEINRRLQCSELPDHSTGGEILPSPEAVRSNLDTSISTHAARLHKRLIQERHSVITKLIRKNPTFKAPPDYKPAKLCKKLFVPVKEYPKCNFVGLILGPRGNRIKAMQEQTGARIYLRGKGSKPHKRARYFADHDLHVYIEADSQNSLDAAVAIVEKLLNPMDGEVISYKRGQLEELAKLNGKYGDKDLYLCSVCNEEGHKHYACPLRESTFKATYCDRCGSFCHLASNCPLMTLPQGCNSLRCSSGLGSGLIPFRQPNRERNDANLYVGCLPQAVDENQLKELFSPFGKIVKAKVITNQTSGFSKGYGFVTFEDPVDAAVAMTHMNGLKINGKMLAVMVAGCSPASGPPLSHFSMNPRPKPILPKVAGQSTYSQCH